MFEREGKRDSGRVRSFLLSRVRSRAQIAFPFPYERLPLRRLVHILIFFCNYPHIVFNYLNTDLSWLRPLYFSFDRFVVSPSSVAVSRTSSRILNIRPCHVLILFRIFSKGWGEGSYFMWRIWVWLHWWTIRSAGERDVKECKILYNCERFEPRSHFKSSLSLIVRVTVVLNRSVVVDSDGRSNSTYFWKFCMLWNTFPDHLNWDGAHQETG